MLLAFIGYRTTKTKYKKAMAGPKTINRISNNRYKYFKSSDCSACPVGKKAAKPETGFLTTLSAPARPALEIKAIHTLPQLSGRSKFNMLKLHGMGPGSTLRLTIALPANGLSFSLINKS